MESAHIFKKYKFNRKMKSKQYKPKITFATCNRKENKCSLWKDLYQQKWNVADASEYLGISKKELRNLIRQKTIPAKRWKMWFVDLKRYKFN